MLGRFNVTRYSQNAAAITGWRIKPKQTPSVSTSEGAILNDLFSHPVKVEPTSSTDSQPSAFVEYPVFSELEAPDTTQAPRT